MIIENTNLLFRVPPRGSGGREEGREERGERGRDGREREEVKGGEMEIEREGGERERER